MAGIIGHNGAGKSTLLKMLARISTQTHGGIKPNGRIDRLGQTRTQAIQFHGLP